MKVDDEYAARHMAGEGDPLYFDKRTLPLWMRVIMVGSMGLGAAAVVGASLASGTPEMLVLLPVYGAGALLQVAFWTLRTAVTRQYVHIQYGLMGPKIAIADLISAEVTHYDWKRFGGWGVRRSFRGGVVAYNMLGDQGRAVKLVFRDGDKTRTILVSASHPDRLNDAIQEAMKARGRGASLAEVRQQLGVKDAVVVDKDQDEDAVAAEAEVEAMLR